MSPGGKPRTVFLGTPEFAVPSLEAAARVSHCVLVVTQPDKPTGRGRRVVASPVKQKALELGLRVEQPEKIRDRAFVEKVRVLEPDFLITAAYGKILGKTLLQVPRKECLNVHASLLPKYRGAAPINWAVIDGEMTTGVSIMRMVRELDSGAVYMKKATSIGPSETAGELTKRLSMMGAEALSQVLDSFDELRPEEQDHEEATWAPVLTKSDGLVDWSRSSVEIERQVRGMHPWPCAWSHIKEAPIKIHTAMVLESEGGQGVPGRIAGLSRDGIDVDCGFGVLRLCEVQAQGKKKMDAGAFQTGARLEVGWILG